MMKRSIAARAVAALAVAVLCGDIVLRPDAVDQGHRILLYGMFALAGLAGILMLVRLRQDFEIPRRPVRIQVVMDVVIVTALVYFTGDVTSLLAFVYIIVVLEAGILLSRFDSLVVATVSSLAMLAMLGLNNLGIDWPRVAGPTRVVYNGDEVALWRDVVVYIFAFYLTAFVSGYWSFKFRRMLDFQRSLLNYLNSGFLIVDRDGLVRTFNVAAQNMLGYPLPAVMNRPVSEILRAAPGTENPVESTLRTGGELTSHEFTGYHRDGSKLPFGITTSVIRDRHGRVDGVIASFADMTDLERARRELRERDRLAAIGRLAAGLAHEIRNPVAVIRGAIEELKDRFDDPDTMRSLADIAVRESDQLNAIVTGFLDYARGSPRDVGPLDLRLALEDVVALLRRDSGGLHKIELTVTPKEGLLVEGDDAQLKQAVLNIGKNALEAMHRGGTLTIAAENDGEGGVAVAFRDTGSGISDKDLSTVFEPFFTTKPHGVGMGLAVVHRIVTSHGGTVRVDSTAGRGTTVWLTFPRHFRREQPQPAEPVEEVALNASPASTCS